MSPLRDTVHLSSESRNGDSAGKNIYVVGSFASPTISFGSISLTTPGGNPTDVYIAKISKMTLATLSTNVSCDGYNNGTASVTVTDGTPPYTYNWSNGTTTNTTTGLSAGTYTVTVIDGAGNSGGSSIVSITQPAILTTSLAITSPTCDNNNGSVTAATGGGTSPYTYFWSSENTIATVTGLTGNPTQTLIVTITDANNCTLKDTAIVQCVTGVTNYDLQNQFIISPNPNNGTFIISTKEKEYSIIITSILGEKIYSSQINSEKSEIDLSKQPNGVYFLQLTTEQGITRKKIVVSR